MAAGFNENLALFEVPFTRPDLRPLSAYSNVMAYLRRLLALPAFVSSVQADHIKAGSYSIKTLNPTSIVPAGPLLDYL